MIQAFQTEIQRYLHECDTAQTTHRKGKAFEDLACFVFGSIPGITITWRDQKNVFQTQEIDLVLWNDFAPNGLTSPAFPSIIFVECKNWTEKVSSIEIGC